MVNRTRLAFFNTPHTIDTAAMFTIAFLVDDICVWDRLRERFVDRLAFHQSVLKSVWK